MTKSLLEKLVLKYYSTDIEVKCLISNPNISIDFIHKHLRHLWDNGYISFSPHLTIDFIMNNPDLKYFPHCINNIKGHTIKSLKFFMKKNHKFNWTNVSRNIDLKQVTKSPNTFPWDWYAFSDNPTLNIKFVLDNISRKWNMEKVFSHKCVNLRVLQIYNKHIKHIINFDGLSANPNLNIEMINMYRAGKWNRLILSSNPKLTIKIAKCVDKLQNRIEKWDMKQLSINEGITMEDIDNNPNIKWYWKSIHRNPNFSSWFFKKYQTKIVTYKFEANMRNVMSIVEDNPDYEWDWCWLSESKYIDTWFIDKYWNKGWCRSLLSENPNLTLELIEKIKKYQNENGIYYVRDWMICGDFDWDKVLSNCKYLTEEFFIKNMKIITQDSYVLSCLARNRLLYDDVKNRIKVAYVLGETELPTDIQRYIIEKFF